jgi:hypothetical protein
MNQKTLTTGILIGLLLGHPVGCSQEGSEDGAGSATAGSNASEDAGLSAPVARVPISVFEADLPQQGQFCSLLTAVECDGSEDCPEGQICCGTLEGALAYESIRCQDRCDLADGGRILCHENEPCPDPEQVCMRSIVLPSYLGICGTPSAFTPSGFDSASTAPGEINCGAGVVCPQGMVCCSLTSWDAESQGASFIDGRCVADPEECSCTAGVEPVSPGTTATGDAGN